MEETMKFKKAHMGKTLTLFVGNGDKRIMDNEVLEGSYWQKFADQGFLVRIDEDVDPLPEPVKYEPKAEPEPEPVKYEPKAEPVSEVALKLDSEPRGAMTRSGADKMAKSQGSSGMSVSTKSSKKKRHRK
jgi:hypothetical protein